MERLSGLDASFLYQETPTLHMHTLKLAVLDPVPGAPPVTRELVRDEIARRLQLLPPFRQRLVEVPGRIHHPVWIEDPDLDLDAHVRSLALPSPGDRRQLDDAVGRVASVPLARDRPLWELWVIEGLEGDRIGILVKLHHAAADGVAATALLTNVTSESPQEEVPPGAGPDRGQDGGGVLPEAVPSRSALVVGALADHVGQVAQLPRLVGSTTRRVRAAVGLRREAAVPPPRPIVDVPRTPFSGALTARRAFATAELGLADVRRVGHAFGVTVNDVVLAVVGGGLRDWLAARGQLPERSLVAGVPVSSGRPEDVARLGGNRVSNLFTTLATDDPDPVARLATVHQVTSVAKQVHNLLGADLMASWVQYTPPGPMAWASRLYGRWRVADHHRPPLNVVVSNVPGPRTPRYAAGARLAGIWSVGPILEGIGLNVTVWSYLDTMYVAVLTCPDLAGDPHDLSDRLSVALATLVARVEGME